MASPSTNGDTANSNASNDLERRNSHEDIEMAAQPQGSFSSLRRSTDRRRPRSRIVNFSFLGSFTSSINSTSSAQSSVLTEEVAGSSRRNSFNVDVSLSPDMIDEDTDHVQTRRDSLGSAGRNSVGSVDSSSSQRSNSAGSKILRLFSSQGKEGDLEESAAALAKRTRVSSALRRYGKGEYVLISNHDLSASSLKLVNLHGFAEWDAGEAWASEEERGPFVYLLAQVKSVHYTENLPYYTVTRMDDGEEQRADVEYMEPITNQRNIDAAKRAALKRCTQNNSVGAIPVGNRRTKAIQARLVRRMNQMKDKWRWIQQKIKTQLAACLNGNRPYSITCRFTGVNLLVVCSCWFLFIDQLRLVYAPPSMDYQFAVISFIVWLILVLELLFEVCIRPSNYFSLLRSEDAYLPSTVRYISSFHVWTESIALLFFIPEFMSLFKDPLYSKFPLTLTTSCVRALFGPDKLNAFYGQSFMCLMRLRIFGLVRHWEKMWVNNTFVRVKIDGVWTVKRSRGLLIPQGRFHRENANAMAITESILLEESTQSKQEERNSVSSDIATEKKLAHTDDIHLTNASKIGTALLTTNAQRGLILIFVISLQSIVSVLVEYNGGTNQQMWTSVDLLQSNNLALNSTDDESCDYFDETVHNWISSNLLEEDHEGVQSLHLISLDIQPVRCQFQINHLGGMIWEELCAPNHKYECTEILSSDGCREFCTMWPEYDMQSRSEYAIRQFQIRPSMTVKKRSPGYGSYSLENGTVVETDFYVEALFNERISVTSSILSMFFLQLGFTLFILLGLSVLRYDAGRLVLGPLRRMLKIVAAYSKNPLAPPPKQTSSYRTTEDPTDALGTFETEQLINTVTKITDLLRKCWGVAGAGIISSNLARQENENGLAKIAYFNPTVPGKAVYALFAFVSIDNFKSYLHNLQGDIMILINDVAAILHEEVYRWGYEDKGQCNKNLGSAFLMVYRIGAVSEVIENRKKAEKVIFSSTNTPTIRRRFSHHRTDSTGRTTPSLQGTRRVSSGGPTKLSANIVDNLDLSSLPGIQAFADRALLGLLKTFASIHRDKTILNWNDDFRLGAGVREVSIELFFGMDAGWAVEGAVGSGYKIDATYLSPHVNMASRMMSATKQYGLFLLLSQKVESLLSVNAQKSLRHVDTVTVKGSTIQQKIFTFDMKVREDFFLYSKSDGQNDLDSERYSPATWDMDQDLIAMRNHISDEFLDAFNQGRDEYLAGKDWNKAIELLKMADKLMCTREVEEGYTSNEYLSQNESMYSLTNIFKKSPSELESDECHQRLAMGDGPCQRLIKYMVELGGEAPDDWAGYRPLTNK